MIKVISKGELGNVKGGDTAAENCATKCTGSHDCNKCSGGTSATDASARLNPTSAATGFVKSGATLPISSK